MAFSQGIASYHSFFAGSLGSRTQQKPENSCSRRHLLQMLGLSGEGLGKSFGRYVREHLPKDSPWLGGNLVGELANLSYETSDKIFWTDLLAVAGHAIQDARGNPAEEQAALAIYQYIATHCPIHSLKNRCADLAAAMTGTGGSLATRLETKVRATPHALTQGSMLGAMVVGGALFEVGKLVGGMRAASGWMGRSFGGIGVRAQAFATGLGAEIVAFGPTEMAFRDLMGGNVRWNYETVVNQGVFGGAMMLVPVKLGALAGRSLAQGIHGFNPLTGVARFRGFGTSAKVLAGAGSYGGLVGAHYLQAYAHNLPGGDLFTVGFDGAFTMIELGAMGSISRALLPGAAAFNANLARQSHAITSSFSPSLRGRAQELRHALSNAMSSKQQLALANGGRLAWGGEGTELINPKGGPRSFMADEGARRKPAPTSSPGESNFRPDYEVTRLIDAIEVGDCVPENVGRLAEIIQKNRFFLPPALLGLAELTIRECATEISPAREVEPSAPDSETSFPWPDRTSVKEQVLLQGKNRRALRDYFALSEEELAQVLAEYSKDDPFFKNTDRIKPEFNTEEDLTRFTVQDLIWFFDYAEFRDGTRPERLFFSYREGKKSSADSPGGFKLARSLALETFDIIVTPREGGFRDRHRIEIREVGYEVYKAVSIEGKWAQRPLDFLKRSPAYLRGHFILSADPWINPKAEVNHRDCFYLDRWDLEKMQARASKDPKNPERRFGIIVKNGALKVVRGLKMPRGLTEKDFYFGIAQQEDGHFLVVQEGDREVPAGKWLRQSYAALEGSIRFTDTTGEVQAPCSGEMAVLRMFRNSVRDCFTENVNSVLAQTTYQQPNTLYRYYYFGTTPKMKTDSFEDLIAEIIGHSPASNGEGQGLLSHWGYRPKLIKTVGDWGNVNDEAFGELVDSANRFFGTRVREFSIQQRFSTVGERDLKSSFVPIGKVVPSKHYILLEFTQLGGGNWLLYNAGIKDGALIRSKIEAGPSSIKVRSEGWTLKGTALSLGCFSDILPIDIEKFHKQALRKGSSHPQYFVLTFDFRFNRDNRIYSLEAVPIEEFTPHPRKGRIVFRKDTASNGYSIALSSGDGAKELSSKLAESSFIALDPSLTRRLDSRSYERVLDGLLNA